MILPLVTLYAQQFRYVQEVAGKMLPGVHFAARPIDLALVVLAKVWNANGRLHRNRLQSIMEVLCRLVLLRCLSQRW
jgi:hypothetical protein